MFFWKKKNEEEYVKCCALCENAVNRGEYMECKYKGQVSPEGTCRKFSYDITKRNPGKFPEKVDFDL